MSPSKVIQAEEMGAFEQFCAADLILTRFMSQNMQIPTTSDRGTINKGCRWPCAGTARRAPRSAGCCGTGGSRGGFGSDSSAKPGTSGLCFAGSAPGTCPPPPRPPQPRELGAISRRRRERAGEAGRTEPSAGSSPRSSAHRPPA